MKEYLDLTVFATNAPKPIIKPKRPILDNN